MWGDSWGIGDDQVWVECRFVKDTLKGDEVNEIRVELKQMVEEELWGGML